MFVIRWVHPVKCRARRIGNRPRNMGVCLLGSVVVFSNSPVVRVGERSLNEAQQQGPDDADCTRVSHGTSSLVGRAEFSQTKL